MTGEAIVILIVVAAAVAYLGRRAWLRLRKRGCNCGSPAADHEKGVHVSRVQLTVNSRPGR